VIGLKATEEDITAIRKKLSPDTRIKGFQADSLEFIDSYRFTWHVAIEPVFRTSGDFANRWITI
jgi:hypothetical protein